MSQPRLSYEESLRRLRELNLYAHEEPPPIPDRVPQPEDEEALGLCFFRTLVGGGADLSNLSMPRTFFGRSEISNVSFHNTDLTESNLRWNDFIDVDFSEATLAQADLRASIYVRVNFTQTDLRGADMRRSSFEECVFEDAQMNGAILTRRQADQLSLSSAQRAVADWRDEDGPEPSGG